MTELATLLGDETIGPHAARSGGAADVRHVNYCAADVASAHA